MKMQKTRDYNCDISEVIGQMPVRVTKTAF